MPCAATHLHLADRILSHWEGSPERAPFPPGHRELREAFVHGVIAPDMGFVPGVDRFVSDLAHYSSPADLTRRLVDGARGMRQEAFAWGWASHVIGDVVLHPMVGCAVGERLYGDRERRMDAIEDLATHVGMEVGLDLALLRSHSAESVPPPNPFFLGADVRHLVDALQGTYGLEWSPHRLLQEHRRAVELTALWPFALRTLARGGAPEARPGGRGGRIVAALTGFVGRLSPGGTPLRGFLRPLDPPGWLVKTVLRFGDEILERMDELVQEGPGRLENRNLETGEVSGPGRGHLPSDWIAAELRIRSTGRESLSLRPGPAPPSPAI